VIAEADVVVEEVEPEAEVHPVEDVEEEQRVVQRPSL
jgi:hypothetical protein